MAQPQPLRFAAFVMNTTSHILYGAWRAPEAQQTNFNDLDHWISLAKTLEQAKFDIIFFADVVGLYDDYQGDWKKFVDSGLQIPSNDPLVLASALAALNRRRRLRIRQGTPPTGEGPGQSGEPDCCTPTPDNNSTEDRPGTIP